jgi:malonate transporter and related proteins
MVSIILTAMLPIVFVAFLGWLAVRLKLFGPNATTTLSTFVVRFALPFALFLAASRARPSDLTNGPFIASLAAGLVGAYVLGTLLGRFVFRHDMRSSALQGLASTFPNMAYCGPPVLIAAVGAQGLLAVIVGNLIVSIIIVPVTIVIMQLAAPAGAGEAQSEWVQVERSLLGAVKQPLVWLPILGAVLALAGVHLPAIVDNAVDEVGKAAGGAALFTLGMMVAQNPVRLGRDVLANLALKNFVQPAIMLGAALALKLDPTLTKAVFLIGVMPTATAASVLAQRYGVYAQEAASTTAASTLLAIFTISGALAIASTL